MKKLTLLFLFISTLAFSQTNYVQVGNTLQQKDTVINGQTVKTYKVLKGSTGVWYPVTREWVLANTVGLSSLSATSPIFYNSTTGVISSQAATSSLSGYMTTSDQSFTGVKNFADVIQIRGTGDRITEFVDLSSVRQGYIGKVVSSGSGMWIANVISGENIRLLDTGGIIVNGNITAPSFIGDLTGNASTATNVAWTGVTGKPTFATVATSGAYSDLSGTPTIPTNTNELTNGAGFITSSALVDYLPLAGGTLTGALAGSSASFSGDVSANSGSNRGISLSSEAANYASIRDKDNFPRIWFETTGGYRTLLDLPVGGSFVLRDNAGNILNTISETGLNTLSTFPKISTATAGRIPYFTTAGLMTDDSDLTFDGLDLTAGGDVTVKRDLKIWGYNAAQAGFISSVDAGGGLALQASGTNKGIRLTTTGSGKVELFGSLNLNTSPSTSAGSYEFLTRNTSTGDVEKVGSTSLSAGTYTPTIGTSDNASSITPGLFHYKRIGNEVSVTGYVTFTTDMSGSGYVLVSLPVASSLTNANQIAGTATSVDEINIDSGFVNGDETADAAKINFQAMGGDLSGTLYVSFMYSVL